MFLGSVVIDEAFPYGVVMVHEEFFNMLESFVVFLCVEVVYYRCWDATSRCGHVVSFCEVVPESGHNGSGNFLG